MKLVTVLTPTYNRKIELARLYSSLIKQNIDEFTWLIVDDGSTDGTENEVKSMIDENRMEIRYIKKVNGGKHTALNVGISEIDTPLTIIVDSDDYLTDDAIQLINKYWYKYKDYNALCGFSFLKVTKDGKPCVNFEKVEFIDTHTNFRIKMNNPGDMAEVFYTVVLKKYQFPEFKSERFLSEDVVWIEMGLKYKTVYVNLPIYVCQYLEGGLTANDKPAKFTSPLGSMMRGKVLMNRECGTNVNLKGAIIYNCYKLEANGDIPQCLTLTKSYEKALVNITRLLGGYFNKKWKRIK